MSSKDSSGSTKGSHDATMSAGSTVAATPGAGHNSSAQRDVYPNPDPALDISNEHHHPHVHHGPGAVPDEKDDIVYAKASDKYTGDSAAPDYKVRQMGSNEDEESGRIGHIVDDEDDEGGPAKRWSMQRFFRWFKRFYRTYRWAFHIFYWAVWTA